MELTRRELLKKAAIASSTMAFGCGRKDNSAASDINISVRSQGEDRPNILLVLVDQEREPRHTRPLHTPSRDRLHRHGIQFTNAHCTYPLCSPSRATVLTGRYPHQAGIFKNCDPMGGNPDMATNIPTLGHVMSGAGYRSGYFGKWHLSGLTRSRSFPERYGFDDAFLSNQVIGLGSDEFFARKTGQWIARQKSNGPWFAVYAPLNPHDICYPGLRHFYPHLRTEDVQHTAVPPNYSSIRSPNIRTTREKTIDWGRFSLRFRGVFDESYCREYIHFYTYLIEEVDRNFGLVLDALESSGQWDDTVVIYTSDHGEMAGSHGFQNKGPTMYEETMNIPLTISCPGEIQGHVTSDALVSNLDIVPTMMSIAGTRWPEKMNGKNLLNLAEAPGQSNHKQIFAEGGTFPAAFWRGVRTKKWKYWHYVETGEELLFNMEEDPYELHNIANDNEQRVRTRRFREMVRSWRKETSDPIQGFLT